LPPGSISMGTTEQRRDAGPQLQVDWRLQISGVV
jgi:hypothetical protein